MSLVMKANIAGALLTSISFVNDDGSPLGVDDPSKFPATITLKELPSSDLVEIKRITSSTQGMVTNYLLNGGSSDQLYGYVTFADGSSLDILVSSIPS